MGVHVFGPVVSVFFFFFFFTGVLFLLYFVRFQRCLLPSSEARLVLGITRDLVCDHTDSSIPLYRFFPVCCSLSGCPLVW